MLFSILLWLGMGMEVFSLEIPKNLNKAERKEVLESLGISSSTKFLSNPYALGGYAGVEVGVSYQFISLDDLSLLGDKADNDRTLALAEFSFGKGLYNNVDMFFSFAPLNQADNVSSYGGILKWGFYQAKFIPVNFSILLNGTVFHAGDSFVSQTLGAELISGFIVDNMALYLGLGHKQGEGRFMGGTGEDSVLPSGTLTTKESVITGHAFLGINFQLNKVFIAAQIDRYVDPVFSGKLGLRF